MSRKDRILLFSMCICASVIGGAVMTLVLQLCQEAEAAPETMVQDNIKTKNFELVDYNGKSRIVMSTKKTDKKSGTLTFAIKDHLGRDRIKMSMIDMIENKHSFGAVIEVMNTKGTAAVFSAGNYYENGMLTLSDEKTGKSRISLKADDVNEDELIVLSSKSGEPRVALRTREKGGEIHLLSSKAKTECEITLAASTGAPFVYLGDKARKASGIALTCRPELGCELQITNSKGKPSFQASVSDKGGLMFLLGEDRASGWIFGATKKKIDLTAFLGKEEHTALMMDETGKLVITANKLTELNK